MEEKDRIEEHGWKEVGCGQRRMHGGPHSGSGCYLCCVGMPIIRSSVSPGLVCCRGVNGRAQLIVKKVVPELSSTSSSGDNEKVNAICKNSYKIAEKIASKGRCHKVV